MKIMNSELAQSELRLGVKTYLSGTPSFLIFETDLCTICEAHDKPNFWRGKFGGLRKENLLAAWRRCDNQQSGQALRAGLGPLGDGGGVGSCRLAVSQLTLEAMTPEHSHSHLGPLSSA